MSTNEYEYACGQCDWQGHFTEFVTDGPGPDDPDRAVKMRCPQCGSSEIDSLAPDSESD